VVALALCGCARARITLPNDPGIPLPDFKTIHTQLSTACAGVRTLTAEIGMSGRAGRQKLRGRVVAGFARPASMRLEGVAPFGPPAFILVARGENATLVLPRDERVLRGARPEDILGALTGVTLGPADLQAILTGCVVPAPQALDARRHANGWASIDLAGGATIYLQPVRGGTPDATGWQIRAATRAGWQIEYPSWSGSFPQTVRLQSAQAPAMVDLTAALSQVETNKDLEEAAFTVNVPQGAEPISLDELRDAGPLGESN
jgi:outer membrane lipoprotein-sorting protein